MSNENWNYSVGGVVLRDKKILLVRHTYGSAKDKLLIPGGYLQIDEMPEQAAHREVLEETGVIAKAKSLLAMRFTTKEAWYAVFMMDYISGEPRSDNDENSQACFMELNEALQRDDLTDFSRVVLRAVINNTPVLECSDYCSSYFSPENYSLFGMK